MNDLLAEGRTEQRPLYVTIPFNGSRQSYNYWTDGLFHCHVIKIMDFCLLLVPLSTYLCSKGNYQIYVNERGEVRR